MSGGTEANNLAIRGLCEVVKAHGQHLITSEIEHSSVRGICDALEKSGWKVTRLPVYEDGILRVEDVRSALRPDTVLITVMLANNEIGTIQPVAEIGAARKSLGRPSGPQGRRGGGPLQGESSLYRPCAPTLILQPRPKSSPRRNPASRLGW